MNAAALAYKLDNALLLAGYKMRVRWNARQHCYDLQFGHNSRYPHVYAYTSSFFPRSRRYVTTILPYDSEPHGVTIDDTYAGDIRQYVRANAASYARTITESKYTAGSDLDRWMP